MSSHLQINVTVSGFPQAVNPWGIYSEWKCLLGNVFQLFHQRYFTAIHRLSYQSSEELKQDILYTNIKIIAYNFFLSGSGEHYLSALQRAAPGFLHNTQLQELRVLGTLSAAVKMSDVFCPGNNYSDIISPRIKLDLCLCRNHFLCHRNSDASEVGCVMCEWEVGKEQISLGKKTEMFLRNYRGL